MHIFVYFFFFFSRCYNPWWVLACFTILFHNLLSLRFSLQFLTFIFFKSSSAWSSHLNLGLPTALDEHGSHSDSFLAVLVVSILITCAAQRVVSILITCAAQRNLHCDIINLTILFFLNRFSNSSFVFILHAPSLSCVGTFLSTLSLFHRSERLQEQWKCETLGYHNSVAKNSGLHTLKQ